MGDFDKVIKENIETILLALGTKLLGIEIRNPVDLPEKIQTTVEREPDFLKKITDDNGLELILHLEFQTKDEPKMVYRMAEYKALLQRKFEIPVKQFVIYLGTRKPKMSTELKPEEKITGFELKDIHQLPVDQVLESDIPEEIVLSILTDYPKADAEKVIGRIIEKLRSVSTDETTLKKNIQQLLILSRLRKLGEETKKQIEAMPITYDIKEDYLYKQAKKEIIEEMLKDPSLTMDKIAKFTKTSIEFIKQIKNEHRKN